MGQIVLDVLLILVGPPLVLQFIIWLAERKRR